MARLPLVVTALLVVASLACYGDSTGLLHQACYIDYTATLNFADQSAASHSYDVLLDGSNVATIAKGQTSQDFVVNAWMLHVVAFNYAGSDSVACPQELYTPGRCETHTFVCRE